MPRTRGGVDSAANLPVVKRKTPSATSNNKKQKTSSSSAAKSSATSSASKSAPTIDSEDPNEHIEEVNDMELLRAQNASLQKQFEDLMAQQKMQEENAELQNKISQLQQKVSSGKAPVGGKKSLSKNASGADDAAKSKNKAPVRSQNNVEDNVIVHDESLSDQEELVHESDEDEDLNVGEQTITSTLKRFVHGDDMLAGDPLSSFFVAGVTVNPKIKAKIWAGEYIELGILKPRKVGRSEPKPSTSSGSAAPSDPKQPATFLEWFEWFTTFAAIYCTKQPKESVSLFSYMQLIYGLYQEPPLSYVWRTYDEEFRKLRALCNEFPWHTINSQTLRIAKGACLEGLKGPSRRPGQKMDNSKGHKTTDKASVCFQFNDRDKQGCRRANCKYAHKCAKCFASHPAYACKRDRPQSSPVSNQSSAKRK